MKLFYLLLIVLLMNSLSMQAQGLDEYRWKNRIILIFTPSETNESFQQQLQELMLEKEGLEDRDLLVFQITGNAGKHPENGRLTAKEASMLRNKFKVETEQFTSILVGKDGGEKQRWSQPVKAIQFFGLIDTMPMRQAEIRRRGF